MCRLTRECSAGAGGSQPGGGAGDGEQPPHQAARQAQERQVRAAQGPVTLLTERRRVGRAPTLTRKGLSLFPELSHRL